MHDRSLDLFAPFAAPRPLGLFPTGAWFPPLSTNLGASGPLWQSRRIVGEVGAGGRAFRRRLRRDLALGNRRARQRPRWADAPDAEGRRRHDGDDGRRRALPAPAAAPAPQGWRLGNSDGVVAETIARRRCCGRRWRAPAAPVALRSNFAETAFWQPQLLTGADGSAAIEFTVPDSVTSWRVWVAALSQTLASGYVEKNAESVKELMIRPYLPRFLREGDVAQLKVVVNSAGEAALAGEATLEITDPETNVSLLAEFGLTAATAKQPFRVEPGKGVDLTFALTAPRRVGPTAFKIVARAGNLSDGELRPLPLLPSRIHLAQSRFVTLKGAERREMTFDDMKKSGPDAHRRADGRHRRRPALLLDARRAAVPHRVSVRVHRTDAQPVRLERHDVEPLRAVSGGGARGRGDGRARDAARAFRCRRSQPEDGARGDPLAARVARRRQGRARLPARARPGGVARPARRRAGEARAGPAPQRRLPLVRRRTGVALHDALPDGRPGPRRGVRRPRAARDGAARLAVPRPRGEGGLAAKSARRRLLLGAADLSQLRRFVLSRQLLDGRLSLSRRPPHDPRLLVQALARPPAVAQAPAGLDARAPGPAQGRRAGAGVRHGLGEDDARRGDLLAARGPRLALVQRPHRDPRLGAAHPDGGDTVRPAPRRPGAVALPQQEAQSLEVDPGDRRGALFARRLSQGHRNPRGARGGDGEGGEPDDDLRLRARPVHRQEEPGRRPRRQARRPEAIGRCGGRHGHRREADAGAHVRLRHLALLDRGAARRVAQRPLRRRAPLLQARQDRCRSDARADHHRHCAGGRGRGRGAALVAGQSGGRVRPPARSATGGARARSSGVGLEVGSRHLALRGDARQRRQLLLREPAGRRVHLQVPPARQSRRRVP